MSSDTVPVTQADALEPFLRIARDLRRHDFPEGATLLATRGGERLTYGDFRKLLAATPTPSPAMPSDLVEREVVASAIERTKSSISDSRELLDFLAAAVRDDRVIPGVVSNSPAMPSEKVAALVARLGAEAEMFEEQAASAVRPVPELQRRDRASFALMARERRDEIAAILALTSVDRAGRGFVMVPRDRLEAYRSFICGQWCDVDDGDGDGVHIAGCREIAVMLSASPKTHSEKEDGRG